ncbi:MAG: TRAP transporter substrate-binding protein [Pseudomonadota bacterium]|uniref:TRAP transporter substrate-binding protein n=1 Tax=Roseovarius TaxID=74030 RepID=UPI0022A799E9|nr:TRAP transporter substrate-binding protein [Roseovarius sp. EGI FJ00037]MCZ0811642.1 TRAP transporter substrate-binding protein [Roseovarius sp. EGI FJ00037]
MTNPGNPMEAPSSEDRRNFLKLTGTAGFTVAVAAVGAGTLGVPAAEAQTSAEEAEREAAADHVMTIATAYRIGTTRTFPVMQLHLKENIQNASRGKVYVRLVPNGSLGAGAELAEKVQNGTIQAAQHSMANFAPFASAVDIINLPFWCGDNQKFVNLVTSDIWKSEVDARVAQSGFKVLLYQPVDPRTVSVRRGLRDGPVKTPEDIRGIKFRVPGSKILAQTYSLLGANPTPIAWGETPSALRQGVADALDPNVMGLNLFGFKDIVSHVTFTRTVPDGGVYSCNAEWFDALDSDTREAVEWGARITFLQNLSQVPSSRNFAMNEMAAAGVQFYSPTDDEMAQWVDAAGAQRPEWDDVKKELVGSIDTFEKLREAAETDSGLYVHDA